MRPIDKLQETLTMKTSVKRRVFPVGIWLLLALQCLGPPAFAQVRRAPLNIGDLAPGIKLERLLQARPGTNVDWKSLKGQIVVVEFWATWCSPCVPAITHLNKLAETFRNKPVKFLAITDEDTQTISTFTQQRPISGWIGLDTDHSVFDSYGIVARPTTILVDAHGKIAAITMAKNITPGTISDLLAGKPISLPLKSREAADLEWDRSEEVKESDPQWQVIIKPSQAVTGGVYPQPGRITGDGVPLVVAIYKAYDMPPERVINRLPSQPGPSLLRFSVTVPKGREDRLHPFFQQALEAAFEFKTRRETRELDVFVLTVSGQKTVSLVPSQAGEQLAMFAKGKIRGQKQTLGSLAELLSGVLNAPVVDETGIQGEYDWELPYNHAGMDVLATALRERLGLELTATKRKMEVLIVEKAESSNR